MDSDFGPAEMTSVNYDDDDLPSSKSTSSLRKLFKKPAVKKKAKENVEADQEKKLYMIPSEEKALLSAMLELNKAGWKSGQGCRPGTYEKYTAHIRSQVPGSRVKGPNVNNKLHSWTKSYRLIAEFVKRSEVTIDQSTHSIVVDSEDIWKELQESNSKFLTLREKFFPYYEQWAELFGQFRATGSGARDHGTAEARHYELEHWREIIDEYKEEEDEQQTSEPDLDVTPTSDKSTTTALNGVSRSVRAPKKKANVEVPSELELGASKTLASVEAVCNEMLATKKDVVEEGEPNTKTTTLLKQVEKIENLTFT